MRWMTVNGTMWKCGARTKIARNDRMHWQCVMCEKARRNIEGGRELQKRCGKNENDDGDDSGDCLYHVWMYRLRVVAGREWKASFYVLGRISLRGCYIWVWFFFLGVTKMQYVYNE